MEEGDAYELANNGRKSRSLDGFNLHHLGGVNGPSPSFASRTLDAWRWGSWQCCSVGLISCGTRMDKNCVSSFRVSDIIGKGRRCDRVPR